MTSPASRPPYAVSSIILSMGLVAVGNGLMMAYIPVKLAAVGFPPNIAGNALTSMAAGGLIACFTVSWMVKRGGHKWVFVFLAATVALALLALTLRTEPVLWISARGLHGYAVAGLFIVSQSWLNDASGNIWRGKVTAAFYMVFVLSSGAGAYLLTYVPVEGGHGPVVAAFFAALAVLPVGLTALKNPPAPASSAIAIRTVWRLSPGAFAALLAVGGLTMLIQGFAPIYATAENYAKADIALLMLAMQTGMIWVQLPLGALSDRIDRRYVLFAACLIVVASAAAATQIHNPALLWLALTFAIWTGAAESIYTVGSAHANDRAEPQYYVALTSTLIVAWSITGVIAPALATALGTTVGPKAFMYVTIGIAFALAVFVGYRLLRRKAL